MTRSRGNPLPLPPVPEGVNPKDFVAYVPHGVYPGRALRGTKRSRAKSTYAFVKTKYGRAGKGYRIHIISRNRVEVRWHKDKPPTITVRWVCGGITKDARLFRPEEVKESEVCSSCKRGPWQGGARFHR